MPGGGTLPAREGTPPVTDTATGAVEAVYGVAVDDEHNIVRTTNTRNNTVSVYSQRTGEHLASLPDVNHAREIVVDEKHDTVWASAFGDGTLVAFDAKTPKEKERVTVEGAGPTGLTVNEKTGALCAAGLDNDRLIELARGSQTPRFVPAGDGPISVSPSKNGKTAYTADQTSGTLSVIDLRSGTVTRSVATGAGALPVATDERSGDVLVVDRAAANMTRVDVEEGVIEETVATGTNPNHVEIADGTAYVVDTSGATATEDTVTRIRVARWRLRSPVPVASRRLSAAAGNGHRPRPPAASHSTHTMRRRRSRRSAGSRGRPPSVASRRTATAGKAAEPTALASGATRHRAV
ncbi:YncE family protein [Streptomyces fumanus]|uniref:YncE family protein n=1 Tax=Streptomyces fumanus TaxID=67302 RepID=UPI0033C3ACFE